MRKQNGGYLEEEKTKTGYYKLGYWKIYSGKIIAWAHPKRGSLGLEQSEGRDHGVPKIEILLQGLQIADGPEQL